MTRATGRREDEPGHAPESSDSPQGGHRGQLLALQGLAGNRATGQLIARLRKSDGLPEHAGLDLAPLLAAQVPELLPLIPADQIEAMQALYDAHASNAELDRRVRAKKNEMRTHGVDPESGSEYSRAQIAKVPGEYKSEDGPLSFQIRTEDVLSDDILQEPLRNKAAEMAFRKWMREELLKSPTVTVSIQANPRAGYKIEADRRAHPDAEPAYTEETAVLTSGRRSLPHTKGKVHFKDLVEQTFAQEYYDRVTHSPELVALKHAVIEIQGGIGQLEIEHKDRIEKNHDHPVVRRVAEALGGENELKAYAELLIDIKKHPEKGTLEERQDELSTECPDLDIWFAPKTAADTAMEKLNAEELELGLLAYMRAQAAFERAANRYERYESRVMEGAGIAVKWLERAKVAGKIAAGTLGGGSVLASALIAGGYSFTQEGAQQASELAQGQRKNMDWGGLAKGAAAEGAMALFGGVTQGAFTRALEARVVERWGAEALKEGGTRLLIGGTAAAASSFYNVGANLAVQKIIYGRANMPQSLDELANMVLDEASTAVLTDAAMQGLHHTFEPGRGQGQEHERPGATERPGEGERHAAGAGHAEPAGSPGGGEVDQAEQRVVDLVSEVHGNLTAADPLIDHFGSWEQTMEHVVRGSGDLAGVDGSQRGQLLQDLLARRQGIVDDVGTKFGGKTDRTEGGPGAGAQVTMEGADAGLRVAQATAYLDATHPGWQPRYKIGLAVEATRAKSLAEATSTLPKELQAALARHQAGTSESIAAARAARGARTAAERAAIVNRVPETWREFTSSLVDFTPEDLSTLRLQYMTESDRAFQQIDPKAAPEQRVMQIRKAIDKQMLAEAVESLPPRAADTPQGEHVSGESAPPGAGHEDATDKAVHLLPEETVMSPGRATSGTDARTMYKNCIAESPGREAAIYRNTVTGEYIVVQGEHGVAQVAPGEAPKQGGKAQRWKELLDAGADVGRWELQAHSHPVEASGVVHPVDRYPSGARGDMGAMVAEARAAGHARSSRIDYRLESGPSHTDFGFDPANEKPYWIDVEGLPGMPRRFGSMESYHEFLETELGVQPGEVPPEMSGKTPALAIEAQAPKAAYNREEDILESLIDLQKRGSGVEPAAERGRGGGGWPRDPMALLEYREAVQSAKAAFASLPGERDGKTVARVEGGEAVESGVVDRPGFEGKAETVGKVGASSLEAGHEGERHPFDNRDPGSYGRTHAERQAAERYPNRPIGVSKEMCRACQAHFRRLAVSRDVPQIVTDPIVTRVFMPDGRVLNVHEVRPSTPGAGQGRPARGR